MTAPATTETPCIGCQRPVIPKKRWQRMTPEERVGKARFAAHGRCNSCYTKHRQEAECAVDGCTDKARTRGWCHAHYARNLRYGSPTGGPPMDKRNGRLDADTLAKLRAAVGIPAAGPTPAMVKAWCDDENGRTAPAAKTDEGEAELDALRGEVKELREAFDILLRERDQLARQVEEIEQLRATAAGFDQRLDDVRTELGKHIKALLHRAVRAERERDAARVEAMRAFSGELDRWARALVEANEQLAELRRDTATVTDESGRLRVEFLKHRNTSADPDTET